MKNEHGLCDQTTRMAVHMQHQPKMQRICFMIDERFHGNIRLTVNKQVKPLELNGLNWDDHIEQ